MTCLIRKDSVFRDKPAVLLVTLGCIVLADFKMVADTYVAIAANSITFAHAHIYLVVVVERNIP